MLICGRRPAWRAVGCFARYLRPLWVVLPCWPVARGDVSVTTFFMVMLQFMHLYVMLKIGEPGRFRTSASPATARWGGRRGLDPPMLPSRD